MTVVFDLDDTLFAEMNFVRSSYRELSSRYGLYLYDKMLKASSVREAFDLIEADIHEILTVYRHHKPSLKLPSSSLFALNALARAGYRIGIISDGRSVTQRNKIKAFGLYKFVDPRLVMISEEIGSDKLSGEAVRKITDIAKDTSYLYIGDNPLKDFFAPKQAGWTTILVKTATDGERLYDACYKNLPAAYHPDFEILNLWELPHLIKELPL